MGQSPNPEPTDAEEAAVVNLYERVKAAGYELRAGWRCGIKVRQNNSGVSDKYYWLPGSTTKLDSVLKVIRHAKEET
jgi:hypothetical protein